MAPPHASYPEAYHPGWEGYWTMVPAPQFTRLNVGAYRTVQPAPPPQPRQGVAPPRGRAVNRPPDIITIQGATHQLISPRAVERDQVKVGRREVSRVTVENGNPAPTAPNFYGSGSPAPGNNTPQPAAPSPGVLAPGARTNNPRPRTPVVVAPPPIEQKAPTPIRVMPVTPPPAPQNRSLPEPAPVRATPAPVPNRSFPAPAPVRAAPAPVQQRVSVPEKPPERKPPERAPDNKRK